MGGTLSAEEVQRRKERFKETLPTPPDLTVDRSLCTLTGRSCSDSLELHLKRKIDESPSKAPGIIKALADKLAGLSPSPALAGLGALAVAIFIDSLFDVSPGPSTKTALQEVLAEQRVSEVWDLVDETLKRCEMHLGNNAQLVSDLQRLEAELSVALTRLKNSVLRESHVSGQAVKVWVNGAAFHLHMLIHQQRLEGATSCQSVERLVHVYKEDLEKLFRKHEEMIKSKCRLWIMRLNSMGNFREVVLEPCYLVNENSQQFCLDSELDYPEYLQIYCQHQYGRQEEEIRRYFSEIQRDLEQLLRQEGHLSLE